MDLIPAILTDRADDLETKIRQSEAFTDYVQIDIMDGKFVPSMSINAQELAGIDTSLIMEIHLMVEDPLRYIEEFKEAGALKIVFHYEATDDPKAVIEKIRNESLLAGLAINPETPLEAVRSLVEHIDSLLFLSVNPGFYGSPFIPEVLHKIKRHKEEFPELPAGLDGGVKLDNIVQIMETKADFACIGSALFRAEDPEEAFATFVSMTGKNG